jgi:ATP-dependent helicase/DNAse subunit B
LPSPPNSGPRPLPSAAVAVFAGPARSHKTQQLVALYRTALERAASNGLERALWLAPNGRTAAAVRHDLVRAGCLACLHTGVLTFDDLTAQILIASGSRLKPLDKNLQRDLIRQLVARALEQGQLTFFADAATRSAFVGLLRDHISELKRRNITPGKYAAAATRGANGLEHRELAQLFTDYESLLLEHNLVDDETAHAAARDALAKNKCRRFEQLDLVVADGFTDFTSTQQEIFELLAQRAENLVLSLPAAAADDQSSRPDLFAKTTATLGDLKQHFPKLEVRHLSPRPLPNPAIDHFARHVFAHPKQLPAMSPAAEAGLAQLEIIQAAGAHDEIVQIARRIKDRLTKSQPAATSPGEILVVFRSLTGVAARVREVFTQFGIPFYLDGAPLVGAAPTIKTLINLLQLDADDWPFRRLIAAVTNNMLTALGPESRRAAEWLIRDLQIASGRAALIGRAQSLAEGPSAPNERSEHFERRAAAAKKASPAVVNLAAACDALPKQATPTQWCAALVKLGASLGLPYLTKNAPGWHALSPSEGRGGRPSEERGESTTTPPHTSQTHDIPPEDHAAWSALVANCAALERLDAWLGRPPRKLNRDELLKTLRDITANTSLPPAHNESGCVRILAAPAARNLSARHLFLAGLSEQAFPSPESAGRLAADSEYRALADSAHRENAAAKESAAVTRTQEEMLLFYEVLTRAQESLTISYPALDDKAQTLPPSPYVLELERLLAAGGHTDRIIRSTPQLSPVPSRPAEPRRTSDPDRRSAHGIYSLADWRTQAVARAIRTEGDRNLLASIFANRDSQPFANAIDSGLRIVHARARADQFGPAEGVLESPAIAARLAARFGEKHTWSASQWETYATCPFRFFMEHVLGLEPLGDLVLETDYARRGSRLHDVLAAFHRDWLTLRKPSYNSTDEEAAEFLAHLKQVTNERTPSTPRAGIDAALADLDRRQILKWAGVHFKHQDKYDDGCEKLHVQMTPTHFEFRFGPERTSDSSTDPDSTKTPFILKIGGEQIRITGQIDRIDVGTLDGKKVFNVIDYKSGRRASLKPDQLESGQQLQLPLYVEAAQLLVFGNEATPLQAGYWGMASGFDSRGALASFKEKAPDWKGTQSAVHELIHSFIENIRHGKFPVDSRDKDCTGACDFRMTCRVAQVRSLKKTQWPETDVDTQSNSEELTTETRRRD